MRITHCKAFWHAAKVPSPSSSNTFRWITSTPGYSEMLPVAGRDNTRDMGAVPGNLAGIVVVVREVVLENDAIGNAIPIAVATKEGVVQIQSGVDDHDTETASVYMSETEILTSSSVFLSARQPRHPTAVLW